MNALYLLIGLVLLSMMRVQSWSLWVKSGVGVKSVQTRLFGTGKGAGAGPLQRLQRILANRGLGTRTEVVTIIQQGRVKVKGKVIRSSAERFPANIEVLVDNNVIEEVTSQLQLHLSSFNCILLLLCLDT